VAGNLNGNSPTGPGEYLAWLAGKGFTQAQFTASGFAVDISDSGIDGGTTAPGHFGLYVLGATTNASRVIYNRLEGTPNNPGSTIQGCDGHGNINAHIVCVMILSPPVFLIRTPVDSTTVSAFVRLSRWLFRDVRSGAFHQSGLWQSSGRRLP